MQSLFLRARYAIGILVLLAASLGLLSGSASAWQEKSAEGSDPALDSLLNSMDRAASAFKTAQASFVWDQYQKVVDETDVQKGVIYFRRLPKGVDMAANISESNGHADQKYVLFTGSKVQVYQPSIEQVTEYDPGKRKGDFESFLVLGFGGGGHELLKSFDLSYQGKEQLGGINTEKLQLVPKSQKAKAVFDHILLWIDPARGISVQQQFFEPESGNYRIAKYSDIKLNQKLPNDVFKLRTTGKTKFVKPQG